MVVMILEKVPTKLRGELTRWFIEPKTGVFVGKLNSVVREKLWEHVCMHLRGGGAWLLYSAPTEQGYVIRTAGSTDRKIVDFEGILLVGKSE